MQNNKKDTLAYIPPQLKTGNEPLHISGKPLSTTTLDFWRWAFSDLMSNATRGKLAEFIVATALGIDTTVPSNEWGAYDLQTASGIKIEVKTSSYLQAWQQRRYSTPVFGIAPTRHWDARTGIMAKKRTRQADVYIFCLFITRDPQVADPLDVSQWEFYVVPTAILNAKKPHQKTISIGALQKIASPLNWEMLQQLAIDEVIKNAQAS